MIRQPSPRAPVEKGLSEIIAEILIVILIVALTVIIIGAVTGIIPKMLERTALISVKADVVTTTSGYHVIGLLNQQGNAVNLNGTSQTAGTAPVSFTLTDPGDLLISVQNSPSITGDAWRPGSRVYVYWSGGRFYVTDDLDWLNAQVTNIGIPVSGSWSVNIIDNRVSFLLQKLSVTIP